MIAATGPRATRERLLCIDTDAERWFDACMSELADLLRPSDLLVVNDAATVPASLFARTTSGDRVELRLVSPSGPATWSVVVFGDGDWHTDTDERPPPPSLRIDDVLELDALRARVASVSSVSRRLIEVEFDRTGDALWAALFALGKPVQYSYLARDLRISEVQTRYATRPWAVETPSAGRPLRGELLIELIRRGIGIATLSHAAGLSATGDPDIDRRLPLPERYEIPAATVAAVARAKHRGGRIIAVGTTVVRALESCALANGQLDAGPGVAELVLGPGFRPNVVDGLLTGMHEPTESHGALMQAFASAELLSRAHAHATRHGYLGHEFGDACLVLGGLG